ncbi:MAG: PQQ-dependent sugar dehydrogenase, partial [bacterium]
GKNSKNGKYGIPASNPFASQKEGREVYAYGFRNPNRLFWDEKGQLFATDIGQHSIEEINRIQAGGFYGWPIREGKFVVNPYGNFRNLYPLPKEEKNPSIYPLL